jgi:hypothetical protein
MRMGHLAVTPMPSCSSSWGLSNCSR